jgi:hypothetical protein
MSRVKQSVLAYLSKADLNKTRHIKLEDFLLHLRSLGIELTEASLGALRSGESSVDYEQTLGELKYDVQTGKWSFPPSHAGLAGLSSYLSDQSQDDPALDEILYRMDDKFQRL